MNRINIHRLAGRLEIMADILSMSAAYIISILIFGVYADINPLDFRYIQFAATAELSTAAVLYMLDAYGDIESYFAKRRRLFVMLGIALIFSAVITAFITILFFKARFVIPLFGLVFYSLAFAFMMLCRSLVLRLLIMIRKHRTLLIFFPDGYPEKFLNKLKRNSSDFGRVTVYTIPQNELEVSEQASRLIAKADELLIASNIPESLRDKIILNSISRRNGKGAPVIKIISTVENLAFLGGRVIHVGDTPVIAVKNGQMTIFESAVKRAFDFTAALVGLIVLSPIFLICAAAIKLDSPGPVFYRQERYTIRKKKFNIIKFRTMVQDAEKGGARLATEKDDRITAVGRILRAFRIDELPQLINILKGEMSVVGPRPERPIYADEYTKMVKNYDIRYVFKAGLTGYAQVYGKYNTKVSDKVLLDSIYINTFSLLLDIKIIILTIMIMFTKEATEGVEEDMAAVPLTDSNHNDERAENKSFVSR